MKALMLPIVAFIVFFALGSGAGVYTAKPALADSTLVDSAHADSTGAAAHGDSTRADTSAHGATLVPNQSEPDSATLANDPHAADPVPVPGQTTTAASATPNSTPNTTPNGPAARPTGTRGPNSVEAHVRAQSTATVSLRPDGTVGSAKPDSQPDYQRLASLLSKMGAREAARTVEQLNSTQAAHALAAMSDKQAALVLAQLQPDKAAALLQATIALIPRTVAP
jgi:MgtE intracellular N domain